MSEQLPPANSQSNSRSRIRWRVAAITTACLVASGALVGVGMGISAAGTSSGDNDSMGMAMSGDDGGGAVLTVNPTTCGTATRPPSKAKDGAGREAWATKYGVNRDTMPNLAPVAQATDAQKAAATDLLEATEAATAKYDDVKVAEAAGYDLPAALARVEKKRPQLQKRLAGINNGGGDAAGTMPMLHVPNQANHRDGKVLDPAAPETLMYAYTGPNTWKLIGVMFTAAECYPSAPPDPGGPIMRWHYHPKGGSSALMMHVFFASDGDLAHAYAAEMS